MSSAFAVTERQNGVQFAVRVIPRAGRTALDGVHGSALKVRLGAAPVDGAANAALVELLATVLGVPRRAVQVVRGHTSRNKIVAVDNLSSAALLNALDRRLLPGAHSEEEQRTRKRKRQ